MYNAFATRDAKTVNIDSTNAVVTGGAGTKSANYKIFYPETTKANICPVKITVKATDVVKCVGTPDPKFTYAITSGNLVEGEALSGISCSREEGGTVGEYVITATETPDSNPNYSLTLQNGKLSITEHTRDAGTITKQPTCTEKGTIKYICTACDEEIVEEIEALGHNWSDEWKVVKEATATEEGKRTTYCTRGCGYKRGEVIPAIGSEDEEDPNKGTIIKEAEVDPNAPIDEATLDNKKSEFLEASNIFSEEEKTAIENGKDARVWLEVKKTNESSIPAADKAEVQKAAEKIMGENPNITYFDADLFKQVEGGDKTQLHEPGIGIKVTIGIPAELLNHDKTVTREYKIIRLHTDVTTGESLVDVLDGTFDETTGEFSFETDKFSTFAIAYADTQHVTGVTLDKSEATLTEEGGSIQLAATVAPANAADKNVTWTTSNASVATVDANGKVTAVANGTCTITVTTSDGGFTATCTVKVDIPSKNNTDNNSAATVTAPGPVTTATWHFTSCCCFFPWQF